jgi:hypothetical protein
VSVNKTFGATGWLHLQLNSYALPTRLAEILAFVPVPRETICQALQPINRVHAGKAAPGDTGWSREQVAAVALVLDVRPGRGLQPVDSRIYQTARQSFLVLDNFEVSLEAKSSRVLCEPQPEPQALPRDSGVPRHRVTDEDLG